ncbi:AraC family transcriptional regulator [Ruegeria lacuscaerulensis]|uniref:AraC family transcriptional regulator n=1 Tax=Ruegeria lacuscaerulensis TaxID=55218 RepID=UPI001480AE2F|nr:AraC family transcriptional regulator [Ruegeria lacuscaerulensis]
MQNASLKRSPGSIRILCEEAAKYGVTPEQCLEDTGLVTFDLYQNEATVTLGQEVAAIENFIKYAPDRPGMGIEIGRRYRPEVFGIWGYAILSSPTLRAGLKTAIDFANLSFVIARLRLNELEDPPALNLDISGLPKSVESFVLERHLTVVSNFTSQFLPRFSMSRVVFETTLDNPAVASAIKTELGISVTLSCRRNSIILPQKLLDMPLPQHNPATMENCLRQCRSLLNLENSDIPEMTAQVREATLLEINNDPTIVSIASKLGTSERTLRRRLAKEGTSFRKIQTEAKLAIGHELLSTAGLDVSTVAWRTGYSEPSSFVRAFTKKYGYSPGSLKHSSRYGDNKLTC